MTSASLHKMPDPVTTPRLASDQTLALTLAGCDKARLVTTIGDVFQAIGRHVRIDILENYRRFLSLTGLTHTREPLEAVTEPEIDRRFVLLLANFDALDRDRHFAACDRAMRYLAALEADVAAHKADDADDQDEPRLAESYRGQADRYTRIAMGGGL